MLEKILELDTSLFLFLNSLHSPIFDKIMWHISGKFEWIPLYLTIIFFIFKKFKLKGFVPLIFLILAISISDLISVNLFKDVFQRLRPSQTPELSNIIHLVNNYKGGKFGFVSSHAANSFAIATFTLLLFKNKKYTYFIIFWAILVSYSRIYLGVHYPLDIICGALLGIIVAKILYLANQKIIIKINIKTQKNG